MSKQINRNEIAEKGVLDNLLEPLKELLKVTDSVDTKLKDTAKTINESFKFSESSKGLRELEVNLQKTNKLAEQKKKVQQDQTKIEKQLADAKGRLNKLSVQEERLLKARLQTDQQSIKVQDQKKKQLITEERLKQAQLRTDKQIQAEKEKEARQNAKLAKQKADENNAYKQLSKASRDYKNESKRLGAELLKLEQAGKKNTKEFRDLSKQYKTVTAQARTTDGQLKKLDRTVGDNFRNVGNYRDATQKLTGALGKLGIAFGIGAVVRKVGGILTGFNQTIAELSSITGATGDDLDVLKQKAIELGGSTTLSASEVAESFKLIGSAKPELLESSEALAQVTESAIQLAEAAGIDMPQASKALTTALNQFGAGAEDASKFVDILAAGSKFGAGNIDFLNEALLKAGTTANTAGIDFRETAAALEVIAKSGVPAQKAGTDFRNVLIQLQKEGFGFVDGQFDLQAALKESSKFLNDIQDPAKKAAAQVKLFGAQSQGTGLFLQNNIELLDEMTVKMDENGIAAEQQATNTDTLEGAMSKLASKFEQFILESDEAIGVTNIFKTAINFLAENLGTIIGLIPRLLAYWVIYANRVRIVQAQQFLFNGGLTKMIKRIPQMIRGIKGASLSFKGLGTAMKGIPFVAIVAGLVELTNWLLNTKDATDEATDAEKELNNALEEGNRIRAERISQQSTIDKQVKVANTLTQAQLKLLKQKIEADIEASEQADLKIKTFKEEKQQLDDLRKRNQEEIDLIDKKLSSEKVLNNVERSKLEMRRNLLNTSTQAAIQEQKMLEEGVRLTDNEIANIEKRKEQLKLILPLIKEDTRQRSGSAKATREQNEEIEEQIDLWQEYIDQIEKVREQQKLMTIDTDAIEADELSGDRPSLVEPMNKELEVLEKGYTQQETALINSLRKREISQDQFDRKMLELKIERLQKERQVMLEHGADVTQIDKQIAEAMLTQTGDTLKTTVEQVGNAIADIYSDIFQRQIAELKNQENIAKQVYGTLEKLASEGNIAAQESLAEQIKAQQDAQREQIKLQQRQANIEKARQVYAIIQSQLDAGESPGQAIAKAGGFMTAIQGLIQSLPSFYEGTEDTGKVGKSLDNKGGRLAVLHNNERVLTADQNKHLQGIPNPMIPVLVNKALDSAGNSYDLLAIDELRRTRQAIEKLPQSTYQLESAMGQIVKMVATHKTGNSTTKNTYK